MKSLKYTKGFTLIELMITIALLAIVASIALPNMSAFISSQRLANRVEQVSTLFRFARSEAVRLNQPVMICGGITLKSDGRPNNNCNQANGQSLLAFSDLNNNFNYEASDGDLRSVLIDNSGKSNISIDVLTFALAPEAGQKLFMYQPDGRFGLPQHAANRPTSRNQFKFAQNYVRISASDGKRVRMALIEPGGRVVTCGRTLTQQQFNGLNAAAYQQHCSFANN